KECVGDLFTTDLPAIGHGCNTTGVMGAGIAREFATRYPSMYATYQQQCRTSKFQLGDILVWQADRVIYNLATQPLPGPHANLDAIRTAVTRAVHDAQQRGITAIGLPRIGAGLGGLNWPEV